MEHFYLSGIEVKDLLAKIAEIVESKISKGPSPPFPTDTKYISRKEVANLLKISLPTLASYTQQGWLKPYRIGRRVLFKLTDVEEALTKVNLFKFKKGVQHETQK